MRAPRAPKAPKASPDVESGLEPAPKVARGPKAPKASCDPPRAAAWDYRRGVRFEPCAGCGHFAGHYPDEPAELCPVCVAAGSSASPSPA